MPKVSIILPTHNGSAGLAQAVASVQAQTYRDFELIIVNDGSSDGTDELVQALARQDARIKIISFEKNQGIQRALRAGLAVATGEYVARIDDDDLWCDAEKLTHQLAYFEAHPDCMLLGTGLIVQNELGKELYKFFNPQSDSEIRAKILYRNCFSHSTVMFRRAVAISVGGYAESESTRYVEDYDLWLKLGTKGTLANLPEYSVRWTSRTASLTGTHKLQQFKNQLSITAGYNGKYPHYALSRLKSRLRLYAYWLLGSLTPMSVQNLFINWYKKS